jgi:hypothetical protein
VTANGGQWNHLDFTDSKFGDRVGDPMERASIQKSILCIRIVFGWRSQRSRLGRIEASTSAVDSRTTLLCWINTRHRPLVWKSILLMYLSLTACVVSHEYDVTGEGDKSQSGGCSPTTEVMLTTHLTKTTAVVFWGSVERLHPSHRIVTLSFTFTDDEVASLTKPEVTLTSEAYATPQVIPITTIRRASGLNSPSCDPPAASVYQRPDQPMHRMPGTLYGDAVTDSIFVVNVAVPGNPAEFTIQLPPVKVNDKPIDVTPVKFLRKSSVYFPAQLM